MSEERRRRDGEERAKRSLRKMAGIGEIYDIKSGIERT